MSKILNLIIAVSFSALASTGAEASKRSHDDTSNPGNPDFNSPVFDDIFNLGDLDNTNPDFNSPVFDDIFNLGDLDNTSPGYNGSKHIKTESKETGENETPNAFNLFDRGFLTQHFLPYLDEQSLLNLGACDYYFAQCIDWIFANRLNKAFGLTAPMKAEIPRPWVYTHCKLQQIRLDLTTALNKDDSLDVYPRVGDNRPMFRAFSHLFNDFGLIPFTEMNSPLDQYLNLCGKLDSSLLPDLLLSTLGESSIKESRKDDLFITDLQQKITSINKEDSSSLLRNIACAVNCLSADRPTLSHQLIRKLTDLKKWGLSVCLYKKLLTNTKNPTHWSWRRRLGFNLFRLGRYDEAILEYKTTLNEANQDNRNVPLSQEDSRHRLRILISIGHCLMNKKEHKEALLHYRAIQEEAKQKGGTSERLSFITSICYCLKEQGSYDQVEVEYQSAVNESTGILCRNLNYKFGCFLWHIGKYDLALAHFHAAVGEDEDEDEDEDLTQRAKWEISTVTAYRHQYWRTGNPS